MMTVGEALKILENLDLDEEIFVRDLNVDEEPIFLRVDAITDDPEGVMIRVGQQVVFDDEEESEANPDHAA